MNKLNWFHMLIYKIFYRIFNPIFYRHPEIWDFVRGTPSSPIYVHGDMRKILEQRTGRCSKCEWHPNVCEYCIRSIDEDFDVPNVPKEGEIQ